LAEEADKEKRIKEAQHADLLEKIPADRSKGVGKDRPRIERSHIPRKYKFPI
jgi:hypothetical protein